MYIILAGEFIALFFILFAMHFIPVLSSFVQQNGRNFEVTVRLYIIQQFIHSIQLT